MLSCADRELYSAGEDTLIACRGCDRASNIELAVSNAGNAVSYIDVDDCTVHLCEHRDSRTLHAIIHRKDDDLSLSKVSKLLPDARPARTEGGYDQYDTLRVVLDRRVAQLAPEDAYGLLKMALLQAPETIWTPPAYHIEDVRVVKPSERCVACGGELEAVRAIEVGHTFLLGDRYSQALGTTFARTKQTVQARAHFQMGCHGIGVSRLVNAIAETSYDGEGLRWPLPVSPYEICVIAHNEQSGNAISDYLRNASMHDALLDDRYDISIGKRFTQAKMSGYPIVIVAGRAWRETRQLNLLDRWRTREIISTLPDLAHAVRSFLSSQTQLHA